MRPFQRLYRSAAVVSLCLGLVLFGSSIAYSRSEQDTETIPPQPTEEIPGKETEEHTKAETKDATIQEVESHPKDEAEDIEEVSEEVAQKELDHSRSVARENAAKAPGKIGGDSAIDALIRALSDPDSEDRRHAFGELVQIDTPQTRAALERKFASSKLQIKAQLNRDNVRLWESVKLQISLYNSSDEPLSLQWNQFFVWLKSPHESFEQEEEDPRFEHGDYEYRIIGHFMKGMDHGPLQPKEKRESSIYIWTKEDYGGKKDVLIVGGYPMRGKLISNSKYSLWVVYNEEKDRWNVQRKKPAVQFAASPPFDFKFELSETAPTYTVDDIPRLIAWLNYSSTTSLEIREIEDALVHLCKEEIEPCIDLLGSQEDRTRSSIMKALREINDPRAVEPLTRILLNPSDPYGSNASSILGSLGDDRATDALIQSLSDFPWVRSSSLESLRRIDTPRTRRALDQFFEKSNTDKAKIHIEMDSLDLTINPSISKPILPNLFVRVSNLSHIPMDFSEHHRDSYTILLKAPNGSYRRRGCLIAGETRRLASMVPSENRTLKIGITWTIVDDGYCLLFGFYKGLNVKESGTYTLRVVYWLSPDKKVKDVDDTLGKFAVSNPIKFNLKLPD